jgi:hypothetical protein
MVKELLRYIDCDHATVVPHRIREQPSEETRPSADIGDYLSGLKLARRYDFTAMDEDFPALDFKATDEFLHVWIAKGIINPGVDARLLRPCANGGSQNADNNGKDGNYASHGTLLYISGDLR